MPIGYDDETKARVFALLAQGLSVAETSAKVGVSVQTIHTWRRRRELEAAEATAEVQRVPPEGTRPPLVPKGRRTAPMLLADVPDFDSMTELEEVTWRSADVRAQIEAAKARGSAQAAAQLLKQETALRDKVRALRKAGDSTDPVEAMTPDEMIEHVIESVLAMPRKYKEPLLEALAAHFAGGLVH